jgi:small Trp-rich protein
MAFVIIGVLLLALWLGDVGPFGTLDWWWVALPFGLAVLWWEYADASGWTKRKAMNKMEERKVERRQKAMEALGLGIGGKRRDRVNTRNTQVKAREVSADPTHAGREVAPKVAAQNDVDQRREPRL